MRRLLRTLPVTVVVMACLVIAGCHSSSTQITAPTTSKCQLSATSSLSSVPAAGGSGTVAIDTTPDCTWSASTAASWITLASSTSGQGTATLAFRVGANPAPAARQSALSINDMVLPIDQAAAPCTFGLSLSNPTMGPAGGAVAVQVVTINGCAWTTSSSTPWLTVAGGGNASGQATITAAANAGAARTGTVTIAGQAVTVSQAAASPCTFTIAPTSQTVPAAGGTITVTVTAGTTCSWTSTSTATWITIAAGATGTGNGSVTLTITANTGAQRAATVTIAGRTFTASQAAAACSYSIAPTTQPMPAQGGNVSVHVTTTSDCAWTATAGAPWITVTGSGAGHGDGTVNIAVAANTGSARNGTVAIAGETFTITQAAPPCSFTLAPTSKTFSSAAGVGMVTVTTQAWCTWTASTSAPDWLSITAGTTGTGNGTVTYAVTANTGNKARTGHLTIGGTTFDVTQNGSN